MALNEEQKEQNQQAWQERLARERQDLSASVEEALDDPVLQEVFWSDEDGASSVYPALPDKGIFPPRLSLQSRVIAAMQAGEQPIQAEEETETARDSHSGIPSDANGAGRRYTNTSAQQTHDTNALTRFTQRLTSSVSALHHPELSGKTGPLTPLMADQALFSFVGQKASSLAAIADIEVCTASTTGELTVREVTRELASSQKEPSDAMKRSDSARAPREGSTGALPPVRSIGQGRARDARSYEQPGEGAGAKNRLAGRNTRVRLEVVSGAQGKQVQSIRERARILAQAEKATNTPALSESMSTTAATSERLTPETAEVREPTGKTGEQLSFFDESWQRSQGVSTYTRPQAVVRPSAETQTRSQSGQTGAYTFPHGQTSAHAALRSQTGAIPPVRRDRGRTNAHLSTLRLDNVEPPGTGEIPPIAPSSPIPQPEKDTAALSRERIQESIRKREAAEQKESAVSRSGMTDAQMPALPVHADEDVHRMTWGSLQAVAAYKGMVAPAARGALSGTGYFEDGQGEATIANPYVTEHSVVLITLTSNPGPVVVQYVTLQPQVGFTAHLSAPTTMRTSFNYIVLLGEFF